MHHVALIDKKHRPPDGLIKVFQLHYFWNLWETQAVQTNESYPSWLAHTDTLVFLEYTTVGHHWGIKTIFMQNHLNLSE